MADADADDPLSRALEALLAPRPQRDPAAVRVGPDGLLEGFTLLSREEVVAAFATTARNVAYWRGKKWWPGTTDPDAFEVDAHALDKALREQGHATALERRAKRGDMPALAGDPRGGHRDPRLQTTPIAALLDDGALAAALEQSTGLSDDIAHARHIEAQLRRLLSAFQPESLADPSRARVFTALAETCTRTLQRIAQQEQAMLRTQKERGQLVDVDTAHGMVAPIISATLRELDAAVEAIVDAVKGLELASYDDSRIDSLALEDTLTGIFADARERAVAALEVSDA